MTTDKSASEDAVLDNVFASDRDRGGKSVPLAAEAPVETKGDTAPPSETPGTAASQEAAQQAEEVDEAQLHPVPRGILKKERERFRAKLDEEARARVAAETRAKLYEEQIARHEAEKRQPQPQRAAPQQQQVRIPDPVLEPERYAQYFQYQLSAYAQNEATNRSEDRARDKFGDTVVEEAFAFLQKSGLDGSHFIRTNPRDPWGEMVKWYRKEKTVARIGDDPDAYEKQIEERVRQKVLDELKAGKITPAAAQGAQPAGGTVTRFPGTLADATATGQQGAHLTDEAVMGAVFNTNRRRK